MKVEFWGTYPPPIGGISIHIYRLVHYLREFRDVSVLDFSGIKKHKEEYIRKVKIPMLEFLKLPFKSRRIIHVHTSHILGLLSFLLFGYKHFYVFTVHGKALYKSNAGWKKIILKAFLDKVEYVLMNDRILAEKYMSEFKLSPEKIINVPAYIKPLDFERQGLPKMILEFRQKIPFLITGNAFKLYKSEEGDVYGLDLLIRLIDVLKKEGYPVGLLFCIPQRGDKNYEIECKRKIEELGLAEDILMYTKPISNGFEVWEMSDLFIRPTLTDMEGLSVKEALDFGTPVIASDVCQRPSEVLLFPKQNFNILLQKTKNCIDNPKHVSFNVRYGDNTVVVVQHLYDRIEKNQKRKQHKKTILVR